MSIFGQAWTYARFLRGLPRYLSRTTTLADAEAAIRARLASREDLFVQTARRLLFDYEYSPYRPLFDLAGCTFDDFRASVADRGIEATLEDLRRAGVYFTFEEYKGRSPVVRDGREIHVDEWQFDNPYLVHYFRSRTSGSTGRATPTSTDLGHLERQTELRVALLAAHGALDYPFVIWRPALPSGSGMNNVFRQARMGRPAVRWFTPMVPGQYRTPLKYRVATEAAVLTGRLCGSKLARPEPAALDEAGHVARSLSALARRHGGAVLSTTVSCGLRVALAARADGLPLGGVLLLVAGEPLSPAKLRGMQQSGATVVSDYGSAEMGRIALGCADPERADPTDMHVATDVAAVIRASREVPGAGELVQSLHITAVVDTMPKLLLNLELDDFGELESAPCSCALGRLGLETHLRRVGSFRKLVGEGVTLIGGDMLRILEDVLPARFGGTPLDYQLVEEEDDRGFTRLSIRVSPSVALADEQDLIDAVLGALARTSVAADMARAHWEAAGAFRVVRAAPLVSERGKQGALQVVRKS